MALPSCWVVAGPVLAVLLRTPVPYPLTAENGHLSVCIIDAVAENESGCWTIEFVAVQNNAVHGHLLDSD